MRQPIKTAPKDGSVIKVFGSDGGEMRARWAFPEEWPAERHVQGWRTTDTPSLPVSIHVGFGFKEPTHWKPQ